MSIQRQTQVSLQTDSIKVLPSQIIVPVKADSIKLSSPVLQSIPDVPRRFVERRVEKPVRKELFVPTAEDSISFNLLLREDETLGFLNNTVVKDYLNPVKLSDREWLTHTVASKIDTTRVDAELLVNKEELSINPEQISGIDSSVVTIEYALTDSVDKIDKDTVAQVSQLKQEVIAQTESKSEPGFFQSHNRDVLSGLLLLSVALVGVVRMTNYKYLRELFTSIVFSLEARKMQKTVNLRNQKHAVVLNFLFLFNASIFVYQIISFYKIETIFSQNLVLIPIIMGVILLFGLVKSIIYRFVAFVFETEAETKEYLFYSLLHNKIFALVILPIIVVVPYIEVEVLPILFKIGIGVYVFLYIVQIFRGTTIILNNLASLFYMFLYLCALEIMPLIVAYNVLVK